MLYLSTHTLPYRGNLLSSHQRNEIFYILSHIFIMTASYPIDKS